MEKINHHFQNHREVQSNRNYTNFYRIDNFSMLLNVAFILPASKVISKCETLGIM